MKIKIYQINIERDENREAFMGLYNKPINDFGEPIVDSSIYDSVFEGDIACRDLEDVYRIFNVDPPDGYRARSLSVSDVVEVIDAENRGEGFYFCDSIGFHKVNFDPEKTSISPNHLNYEPTNQIRVLLVKPGESPKATMIGNTLEDMQKAVGGYIESLMPFDDEVALICNEEGKIEGLPLNRAIYKEPEEVDMSYREMKEMLRHYETERLKKIKELRQKYGLYPPEGVVKWPKYMTAYITFSEDSFDKPFSEEARTYEISSDNKAFNCNTGGYSIFGSSLDGSDTNVRLDLYMADERGGADGWKIERCYIKKDEKEIAEIIAGNFLIAYAPSWSDKFFSLPDDLLEKYADMFENPERFTITENGIQATPYRASGERSER